MSKRHAEIIAIVFFIGVVALVFQQIATSMSEQGISSGSPYDNAAAYPKSIAIMMIVLVLFQGIMSWSATATSETISYTQLKRPALLLLVFAVYLFALGTFGYHLSTAPMLVALLWLAGYRKPLMAALYGLSISFGFAFLFEVFLKIVLPGGIWRLNIPW